MCFCLATVIVIGTRDYLKAKSNFTDISTLILILSKLNIAMSSKHMP